MNIRGIEVPFLILALLVAGALCPMPLYSQDRQGNTARARIDTVGSILVTTNLAREVVPVPEALHPVEMFRIGAAAGDDEVLFGGPLMSVSNGPNHQLFVLDWHAGLIRVFGSEGEFLREFGGSGEGPGELSEPSALAWHPKGYLWVPEPWQMRYSVFDSLGSFVKTVPRRAFRGVNRRIYPAVFGTDHVLIDHAVFGNGTGAVMVDTTGTVLDSFPAIQSLHGPMSPSWLLRQDQEVRDALRSLRTKVVWTLAPDGTLWLAKSDTLRLIHRSVDGDTLRIIETNHRPSEFSEAEIEVMDRISRRNEDIEFSPAVVQSLHASDDGHLFVQIAGDLGRPGREMDVFGPQGEYLGSFTQELPIQPLSQSHFMDGRFSYVGVGLLDVPIVVQTRVGG